MPQNTVLIVDDDVTMWQMLRESLKDQDYLIFEANSCKRLMDILHSQGVDIILLDLNLQDGNSLILLPEIRKCTNAPILIVSGTNAASVTIQSLHNGADDYIQKPFDLDELRARIKANLRRSSLNSSNQNEKHTPAKKIRFGQWTLDMSRCQLFDKDNKSADLTIKEYHLLSKLAANPSKVISRDELCESIRERNYVPTGRAIDIKIMRIRKKMGDSATTPKIIKTIRGAGYIFDKNVIE